MQWIALATHPQLWQLIDQLSQLITLPHMVRLSVIPCIIIILGFIGESGKGLNPVSETFPPWLKYISGENLNSSHFSTVSTLKVSPCSWMFLILYLPHFFLCLCFPDSVEKNLHVCLVSEEVDLSNTHRAELIWQQHNTAVRGYPYKVRQKQNTNLFYVTLFVGSLFSLKHTKTKFSVK